jgi:hypothetical protein
MKIFPFFAAWEPRHATNGNMLDRQNPRPLRAGELSEYTGDAV